MGKKYELMMNNIDNGKYTGREILLSGAVVFLAGTLLGMICSPRKYQVIGSHNGNGSCNGNEANADGRKIEKKLFHGMKRTDGSESDGSVKSADGKKKAKRKQKTGR
ncbi:MAG: hypothetical protein PUB22_08480 [Clostridiales bacterium]|nr:hypothetical protein [Clostridiales bacterium]